MDWLLIHILGAIFWIIIGTSRLRLHPLICLFTASIWVGMAGGFGFIKSMEEFISGFGGLIGQIGLIIILGCILGVVLEKSKAAFVLANSIWHSLGRKIPALSTAFMGYIVGIPVFCDSGFILLNPIGKNLAKTSGISPVTFSLSLAGGLYLSHILIPPTPGPLAVAGIMKMEKNLGLILMVGFAISIPVFIVITWWANRFRNSFPADTKENLKEPLNESRQPNTFWPLLVIVLPLLLITLANLSHFTGNQTAIQFLQIIGHPIVAISIGLIIGLLFLKDIHTQNSLLEISFKNGIETAGPILILTGAGAGFGAILRQAGLEEIFQRWQLSGDSGGAFWLMIAFALAAFLKTAQGSSTSAMIITASIALSIIPSAFLAEDIYSVLVISSIGAGAMAISHANDSYFWIIKEFTGLTVKEALRSFSLLTAWMSLTALLAILVIYWVVG